MKNSLTKPWNSPVSRRRNNDDDDDDEDDLGFLSLMGGNPMLDPLCPIIRIDDAVTQRTARDFIKAINTLKKRGEKLALLDISSPGGSVFALFQILNAMDSSDLLFATYNSSHAYSAGAVLLAAGSKGARFIAPLASTMIHPMSCGVGFQGIADVVADANHLNAMNDILLDRLAKDIGITRTKLNKELQKSSGGGASTLYLTPEQSVELGIADVIGIPTFGSETKLTVFGLEEPPQEAKTTSPKPSRRK